METTGGEVAWAHIPDSEKPGWMRPERLTEYRARYLRDPHPVRLGNLASSLARVASAAKVEGRDAEVQHTLVECALFIDWGGPDWETDVRAPLMEFQGGLKLWSERWRTEPRDAAIRAELSSYARSASNQALEWTGLLDEDREAA